MAESLRVLILEDEPADAELMVAELRRAGFQPDWHRVDTESEYLAHLGPNVQIILSDYSMPQWNAIVALHRLQESGLNIPLIVVSGVLGDEAAAECIKFGATDYVLKDRMARLGVAVTRALEQKQAFDEKRLAEEALRESEEQYRTLVEHLPDAVIVWSEGEIKLSNPEAAIIFGAACADDLIGLHLEDLASGASLESMRSRLRTAFEHRVPAEPADVEAMRLDGKAITLDIRGMPIEYDGRPASLLVARDVTEQRQAMATLRLRNQELESLKTVAAYLAEPGTFEDKSKHVLEELAHVAGAVRVLLRLADEGTGELRVVSMVGAHLIPIVEPIRLIGEGASGLAFRNNQPVVINDYASYPNALPEMVASGIRSMVAIPISASGRLLATINVASTERDHFTDDRVKLLEAIADGLGPLLENARIMEELRTTGIELREAQRQLIQAQKMEVVGQLAGGVAHDFNNLLTPILGFAELGMEELPPDHPVQANLQEIKTAGERGAALVRQLMLFSRQQVTQPIVRDANELVLETDRMLRRLIGENIELVCLFAPEPINILIDPGQMEQVLVNMAVNARDAMPDGGKLTIETGIVTLDDTSTHQVAGLEPGQYVHLAISDTGTGMDEETMSHLFEPFFTTKEPDKGTGLGLATCYGIIAQAEGAIQVRSELGQGSTFRIYLPKVEAESVAGADVDDSEELPSGTETVLLVEDEPSVRRLGSTVLERQGYTVLEATNGEEALRVAAEYGGHRIQLLLTDLVMPQMGGRALAVRLHDRFPGISVLFTSGFQDEGTTLGDASDTSIPFLPKPYTPDSLAREVRRVLDADVSA